MNGLRPGARRFRSGSEARPTWTRLFISGRVTGITFRCGVPGVQGRERLALRILLLLSALTTPGPLPGQEPAPDVDWMTFETPHFVVNYPAGLETVARRAAVRAESAHALLAAEFLAAPAGRIHLVLTNNVDLANGSASVVPRRRVVLHVQPPANDPHLSFHDDWLELLILHELVHVFHLENAGGVWKGLRRVLGRDALLFPQYFSPSWVGEGLATYIESAHTNAGRVRGTAFEMILRTAALEGAFFPIDRASLDPVTWPAATTPYVYGAMFVDHLARRYGAAAVSEFIEYVGQRVVPYRLEAAARRTLGTDLTTEWAVWQDSLTRRYSALADSLRSIGETIPEVLTGAGRVAAYPRFAPDGEIVYSAGSGRREPALVSIDGGGRERRLAPISLPGAVSWDSAGTRAIFTTLEYVGPNRLYSDLYALDAGGGRARVTRGARVWEADIHPDGRSSVTVASADGTNVLARVDLATGQVAHITSTDPDVYWSAPRWSPEGRSIAATRWSRGQLDIVILDPDGAVVRQVTDDRAVDSDPAWSHDGRYLIFASDRTGIPNIFAWDTADESLYQVTNVLTGALQPDVSRDGRWVAFSFYAADGYHIARLPFDRASWRIASPPLPRFEQPLDPRPLGASSGGSARPYRAWSTLLPTWWNPVIVEHSALGYGFGARTGGRDVARRHEWELALRAFTDGLRTDGVAEYRFHGLGNPVADLLLLQEWTVQREAGPSSADPAVSLPALLRRDREAEVSLFGSRPRWRSFLWAEVGTNVRKSDFFWDTTGEDAERPSNRFPLDVGAFVVGGVSTVRSYGVALGPQDGAAVSARLQARRLLSDAPRGSSDRSYWRLTGRGLGYRGIDAGGFAASALAFRLEGGIEASGATPGFSVGGGGGGDSSRGADLLRGGTRYPVRGYPAGFQGGNRVVIGSGEFRFPIALVERGFRLLPLAVDRIWGDLFVDAGAAWCPDTCSATATRIPTSPRPLVSVGAEAMIELRLGYFADLPLRFGLAIPLSEVGEHEPELYLRIGRSF